MQPDEMKQVALRFRRWATWSKVLKGATITFFSAAASALIFLIVEVGNPKAMLAWLIAAGIMMFICNVGVKFCDLKWKELIKRRGDDDG